MENKPLHVLHVNMSIDPVTGGGTAERTVQVAKALIKSGHDCTLLTLDFGLTEQFKKSLKQSGVDALFIPCILKRFYVPGFSFRKIAALVEGVDVIHLMGHWTLINALVYLFAVFYKKPYVVCPAGALPIFGRSKLLKKTYNFLLGKRVVSNSNSCVAITEDELIHFKSYGVEENQITIIPNGINTEDFSDSRVDKFRKKHGLGKGLLILFMGRLNEIKGPDLLLDAFIRFAERSPSCQIAFVGPDGGMLETLKERINKSPLSSRVFFLGYLGGAEKSQAYHAADLLAIPSRQEAMSIVVLEAGASGTPVLLTDQCGFDEVERVGGGKVVPASVEGIYRGLECMIEGDKLPCMGKRLNKYVVKNYQWDEVAGKYLTLYQSILST